VPAANPDALIDGSYEERARSQALPNIDLGELERITAAMMTRRIKST
jgi:hypothetical protein